VKRVGLVVKTSNPEAVRFAAEVAAWIAARGCGVFSCGAAAGEIDGAPALERNEVASGVDCLVVLGGDGTMLQAARLLDGARVPILGVNMGGLGFLTAISVEEAYVLLERLLDGGCEVEERMVLSVALVREGERVSRHKVLNDAVVRCTGARLISLEARINREYVTTYRADGLIVATPTGSTAYSLSAAGPILYPTIHSIIVAPICPFNLTNRPVVIPDWMSVEMAVRSGQPDVRLILDGQVDVDLKGGDLIEINRAEKSVFLVKYEGKSYFDILRERLMWEVKARKK